MERIADMNRERKMSVKANKSPTGKRSDVDQKILRVCSLKLKCKFYSTTRDLPGDALVLMNKSILYESWK